MEIGLIRVDSRLIHGQVITKWLNYSKANVIVVVDDELSKDSFMSEIYTASAPNGIVVEILSIDDFMKNTVTHKYSNKRLLILLKNIETVYELYLRQFKMKHIQLYNIAYELLEMTGATKEDLEDFLNDVDLFE